MTLGNSVVNRTSLAPSKALGESQKKVWRKQKACENLKMERHAIKVSRRNSDVVFLSSQQLWSVTCLTPPFQHPSWGRKEVKGPSLT